MSAELWKQYLGSFNSSKLTEKLKKEPIQFIGNKHPSKKARHFFLRFLEGNFNFAYSTIKIILLAVCISRATYITSQIFELYFKRKLVIWPTVKSELFWTPLIMASDQRAEVINSQGDVTHLRVPIFLFRHHVLQNRLKMGEYASRTMAMETTNVNV